MSKYNFSDEQIDEEVARLRVLLPVVTDEGLYMAAWQNLSNKLDEEENIMPAKVGTKGFGKGRAKLGSKKRKARRKKGK